MLAVWREAGEQLIAGASYMLVWKERHFSEMWWKIAMHNLVAKETLKHKVKTRRDERQRIDVLLNSKSPPLLHCSCQPSPLLISKCTLTIPLPWSLWPEVMTSPTIAHPQWPRSNSAPIGQGGWQKGPEAPFWAHLCSDVTKVSNLDCDWKWTRAREEVQGEWRDYVWQWANPQAPT